MSGISESNEPLHGKLRKAFCLVQKESPRVESNVLLAGIFVTVLTSCLMLAARAIYRYRAKSWTRLDMQESE